MKLNFTHLLALIWACLIAFLLFLGMTSCDVTKKQTKHYKKFIKYGGKVNCDNDTVTYRDTIWKDGKPIIKEVKLPCDCGTPEIGYTNKQVRMMLKHAKDSMNYLLKLEKIRAQKLQDSINGLIKLEKQETKQVKQITKQIDDIEDTKQAESWEAYLMWVFFICMVLGLIIALLKIKPWK